MSSANSQPVGSFNFLVAIDGVPVAAFEECDLPTVSIDVIEYRQGSELQNSVHKLPGLVRYGNIVLKRGIASSASSLSLWTWISGFIQGNGNVHQLVVTLLDRQRNPVLQWSFSNAWPIKYSSPVLNGKSSNVAIETLEVAVEDLQVTALGTGS